MVNSLVQALLIQTLLTGWLLNVSSVGESWYPSLDRESRSLTSARLAGAIASRDGSQESIGEFLIPDGTYLYGQSRERDRLGREYVVFAVRRGQTVGAFYQPRSEYSCFYGTVDGQRMNLTVVDPYSEQTHTYAIARLGTLVFGCFGGAKRSRNGATRLSSIRRS